MIGCVPDQIIPVSPLNPVFPSSAENSVHFAGEQVRKDKGAHRKRDGLLEVPGLRFKTWWRIGVNLQLNLQKLSLVCRGNSDILCQIYPLAGSPSPQSGIPSSKNPKHVVAVGGGADGMEVDRLAALRGHQVTLFREEN
jgi:NADPH-dependent 2,4-dienoyl-CoA reductase/sulfur reductase-like enzyme